MPLQGNKKSGEPRPSSRLDQLTRLVTVLVCSRVLRITSIASAILILTSACTINPCLDEAVLYGTLNKEVICYLEKKIKHGPHTKWYPNGESKHFERTYKNDILDGPYREWYTNGQLKIEANYINGQLSGLYKKFYSNGAKWIVGRYAENIKVGTYTEFYKNLSPLTSQSQAKLIYNYNPLGKHEGKQTRYRMNGYPSSEYIYYEGKLVGKRLWRNDGRQEPVLTNL